MPSPPFREGLGIGLIILKDMKKVYVAPQSEIVKLIGKEHTMQMELGLGTQTGSGGTTYYEMY